MGKYTFLNVWMLSISLGISNMLFNVSHYILADQYRTIAERIPTRLKNEPDKIPTTCEKMTYWFIMFLNILGPVIQTLATVSFRVAAEMDPTRIPTKMNKIWVEIGWDLVGICQIISGIILVRGVNSIRSFFKEAGDENYINTGMITQHACAFILYLFAACIFYGSHSVFTFHEDKSRQWVFWIGGLVGYSAGLVAQLFLCAIFY
jgi:hypothetical protein